MEKLSDQVIDLIEVNLQRLAQGLSVVSPLQDAFSYALFPKGKRIRPRFALLVAGDLSDSDLNAFVSPSLALELVHASSLVHDDLPALDNDDYRRGKPSCHKAFGEATAILTGDLLLSEAFTLLSDPILSSGQIAELTRILALSFRDVCHGQQRDILDEPARGPIELIHRLKTGALFRAAAQFGGVFSNAGAELITQLGRLGENIGLLFQVNDDLLDLITNGEGKGRPTGSDQRNNRQTSVSSPQAPDLNLLVSQLTESINQDLSLVEKMANRQCFNMRSFFESMLTDGHLQGLK